MERIIGALATAWSIVPLVYAWLFLRRGHVTEAFWLLVVPVAVVLFVTMLYATKREDAQ